MKIANTLWIAALCGTAAFAQMMGGGGGNNGNNMNSNAGSYMSMFATMGGTAAMGSGMGIGMTDDLAVDTDGTAYVIRAVQSAQGNGMNSSNATWQFELNAISPVDGSVKWKLTIPGGRASHPRLGKDGKIFLTVDNYQMFSANYKSGGSQMSTADAQANDGQLVIVTHTDKSASIAKTVTTTWDVLSEPRIVATDALGNYLVYVVGYDMMSWTQMPENARGSFVPGNKALLVYKPDGTLKFSTSLN